MRPSLSLNSILESQVYIGLSAIIVSFHATVSGNLNHHEMGPDKDTFIFY